MLVFYAHTHTHKGLDYACVYVFYRESLDYACTRVVQRGLDYVCECVCEVGVDFACPRARSGLCMCVREVGLYYACVCVCAGVREVVWAMCACASEREVQTIIICMCVSELDGFGPCTSVCEREVGRSGLWMCLCVVREGIWTMHVCVRVLDYA